MSYCRFSSNRFQCDLYIYESTYGNITVHVASSRSNKSPRHPIWLLRLKPRKLASWLFVKYMTHIYHPLWRRWSNTRKLRPINLPYDGETYEFSTYSECIVFVEECIRIGYVVPDHVLPSLREAQEEGDQVNENN